MRRHFAILCILLAAPALAGCGDSDDEAKDERPAPDTTARTETSAGEGTCKRVSQPDPRPDGKERRPRRELARGKAYSITFETNCGDFTIRLDQRAAPAAAASLVALAKDGYFDDTTFHRVVPGFVIQGGDPTATGTGGPGYKTVDRPPPGARYTRGTVAMAKAGDERAGTAGSQFFVVTGKDAMLPADYALVGEVTEGIDVVDRLGTHGDAATEKPTEPLVIESASVDAS